MNTQKLKARLTPLFEAHKQTLHLIYRLSKLPIQPGSSPLNPEAADARVELSAEIHQSLKEQEEEFELLRQEFEDQADRGSWAPATRRRDSVVDKERAGLAAQITRLGEDLRSARTQFRKAQLQAKRNAEAAKRKERELLFEGVQEGTYKAGQGRRRGQEKLSQDELLLNASNDVTAALRETHALMQSEVSRSQFAHDTLQQSTAALSTLSESYSNLNTLLSSSRSLVSSLLHSQKSDTWYLESAFWLLVTTIVWLVFRRILYGPGWWLLYFPTKQVWKLTTALIRFSFGASAALVGVVGQSSQKIAASEISESIPTSLIVQPSASGGIPKFYQSMSAPTIAVGAGGAGAKDQQYLLPQADGKSMTEEIGKLVEESRDAENLDVGVVEKDSPEAPQGTTLRERNNDEPPNPKKRMWEELPNPPAQGERSRDEL